MIFYDFRRCLNLIIHALIIFTLSSIVQCSFHTVIHNYVQESNISWWHFTFPIVVSDTDAKYQISHCKCLTLVSAAYIKKYWRILSTEYSGLCIIQATVLYIDSWLVWMKLSILNIHFNIRALFLEYTDLMRGINLPYIEYCFYLSYLWCFHYSFPNVVARNCSNNPIFHWSSDSPYFLISIIQIHENEW